MPTLNRLRVRDRDPERLEVCPDSVRPLRSVIVTETITRQRDAASPRRLLDRDERGLEVQRVEDRLGQQDVDAAVDQAAHLLVVGARARRTSTARKAGLFDVRRDRQRAVGRPDRAGDEARASGVRAVHVDGRCRRQPRRLRLIS